MHAQEPAPGGLYEIPVPGGLRAALTAIGDRVPADRSQFLLECIRRLHDMPAGLQKQREAVMNALLTQLDRASATQPVETVPLPLHPDVWVGAVFNGKADAGTLVRSILANRNAAFLYAGLLSLDEPTRAWLASQPGLVGEIAAKHAGIFAVVAPALHVAGSTVQVPGGVRANHLWKTLVGRGVEEPALFIRALLTQAQGRLAYFFEEMSQLTPGQLQIALKLDAPDPAHAVDASRRLAAVFDRIAANWLIEDRVFWRPVLDPALLLAELMPSGAGLPQLPGTRAFWKVVFESDDQPRARTLTEDVKRALTSGEAADFHWLSEQIFKGGQIVQRRPFEQVLFASRLAVEITPANVTEALEAIRAAGTHATVITVLERAGVSDVAVFAKTVRRALQLSSIADVTRANRALAQFQGSLAILTRAALRKAITRDELSALIVSLSDVEFNERGEYDGAVIRWWQSTTKARPPDSAPTAGASEAAGAAWMGAISSQRYADAVGSLDRDIIRLLSGPVGSAPHHVEWEGTRYRIDLTWAEATRLGRMLGQHPRPYLSSAAALVQIAEAVSDPQVSRDAVREQASLIEQVQQLVPWPGLDKPVTALRRAAGDNTNRPGQRLSSLPSTLRGLADELFARGVTEIAYAVALGQPEGALVSAGDAAARHDFGVRLFGPAGAWRFPVPGADRMRDWHVTGALLALDVRLADFALMRVSSRLPPVRPTLNDADRRVLIEGVALMEATALRDDDRSTVVAAIRKGRARLAGAKSGADLALLADEIRLRGARRSLLPWTAAHDAERLSALLSPSELLWLGLESRPLDARLHAWGAPAEPRLGCLCLRLLDRRPLDTLAGRWDSGIFASAFADLNLRLAELLDDMKMPASLLPYVLAAATLDLVNLAVSRGQDDRRGLVAFVDALQPDRVELYLALLTTDGPLVAIEEGTEDASGGTTPRTEVSR